MLIFNTTNEKQSVKACGNWFTFNPGQIKQMNDNVGRFLASERRSNGLVALPEEFEDPDYKNSEQGKAQLDQLKEDGLKSYIDALRSIIYNNQVSLRMDLEKANIKADPAVFASKGELAAMELVAKYQKRAEDAEQAKIERVKELMKEVNKGK